MGANKTPQLQGAESHPLISTISKTKTRAPTTVILGDSTVKNIYSNAITKSIKHKKHVVIKHLPGAKIEYMKHYVKPTHEKQPAQIIIHTGTNDLPGNKNSDKIANEILKFANLIQTSGNNVVVLAYSQEKIDLTTGQKKYRILSNSAALSNTTASLITPPDFFAFKIYSHLSNSPALRVWYSRV